MARGLTAASSEYLDVLSSPLGAAPSVYSIGMWFYKNDLGSAQTMLCDADTNVANFIELNLTAANALEWRARQDAATFENATSSTTISADTWHHALGVSAGVTDRTVYLDGGGAGTNTVSITLAGLDQLSIGRVGSVYNASYWDGRVAEVAIWNAALTAADALMLAAAISPDQVRPDALVFYAPLIRDEDRDLVGGLNLTPH